MGPFAADVALPRRGTIVNGGSAGHRAPGGSRRRRRADGGMVAGFCVTRTVATHRNGRSLPRDR
jgi:hypothetical protein